MSVIPDKLVTALIEISNILNPAKLVPTLIQQESQGYQVQFSCINLIEV